MEVAGDVPVTLFNLIKESNMSKKKVICSQYIDGDHAKAVIKRKNNKSEPYQFVNSLKDSILSMISESPEYKEVLKEKK